MSEDRSAQDVSQSDTAEAKAGVRSRRLRALRSSIHVLCWAALGFYPIVLINTYGSSAFRVAATPDELKILLTVGIILAALANMVLRMASTTRNEAKGFAYYISGERLGLGAILYFVATGLKYIALNMDAEKIMPSVLYWFTVAISGWGAVMTMVGFRDLLYVLLVAAYDSESRPFGEPRWDEKAVPEQAHVPGAPAGDLIVSSVAPVDAEAEVNLQVSQRVAGHD